MTRNSIALGLTLLFSSFTANAIEVESNIKNLADRFYKVMMVCPEKVWTDYNWAGKSVLFNRGKKDTSLLWSADDNSFLEIPNKDVPSDAKYGTYSFFEFQGKPTMSLNSDEGDFSESYMFSLGVHEMFHYQGQKGWTNKSTGGRHTEYPLNAEPRFLRRLIFDNLKNYFLNNDSTSLSQARFWYNEWSANSPKELQSVTDGYEGTARYVDTMAEAIDIKGCGASEIELKDFLNEHVKKDFGSSLNGERFALDSEGYDIGGLAALSLRFNDSRSLSDWNTEVTDGTTPLQIILEDISPLAADKPEELESFFISRESEVNQTWGAYIDDDIENWENTDFVRVSTPFSMVNGSFSPAFFAFSTEIGIPMFPFAIDQTFISPMGNKSNFTALTSTVLIENYDNPCENGPVTLVHKNDLNLSESAGVQEVNAFTATVRGFLVGEKKTDVKGFEHFCLQ